MNVTLCIDLEHEPEPKQEIPCTDRLGSFLKYLTNYTNAAFLVIESHLFKIQWESMLKSH
jgi:hypothetical protein